MSQQCAVKQTHTDQCILSVAILTLSPGSGLTMAEDMQFHHSKRQNRTLHSPLTYTGSAYVFVYLGLVSVCVAVSVLCVYVTEWQ